MPHGIASQPGASAQVLSGHPLAQGLVFAAPLHEGGGLAADRISNLVPTYHDNLNTWGVSAIGLAPLFTSSFTDLNYGSAPPPVANLSYASISCWVALTSTARSDLIALEVNYGGPHKIFLDYNNNSASNFAVQMCTDGSTGFVAGGGGAATVGLPYHLVGTYDGANLKFYVNGVLVQNTAHTGTLTAQTGNFYVGTSSMVYTTGSINNILIWDRALSRDDVTQLYMNPWLLYRTPSWLFQFGIPFAPVWKGYNVNQAVKRAASW